jgi:hypothetical protein
MRKDETREITGHGVKSIPDWAVCSCRHKETIGPDLSRMTPRPESPSLKSPLAASGALLFRRFAQVGAVAKGHFGGSPATAQREGWAGLDYLALSVQQHAIAGDDIGTWLGYLDCYGRGCLAGCDLMVKHLIAQAAGGAGINRLLDFLNRCASMSIHGRLCMSKTEGRPRMQFSEWMHRFLSQKTLIFSFSYFCGVVMNACPHRYFGGAFFPDGTLVPIWLIPSAGLVTGTGL